MHISAGGRPVAQHCNSSSTDAPEGEEEIVQKDPTLKDMRLLLSFFSFLLQFAKRMKIREDKKSLSIFACLFMACEGCNNTQRRPPGSGVCGSDIRQHVKLQGLPQQWNCRWLIDRLLERKPVQIASHFHAPTVQALHKG